MVRRYIDALFTRSVTSLRLEQTKVERRPPVEYRRYANRAGALRNLPD
jgi:hypothetical protein